MDRKILLLTKCLELLERQENSGYVLDLLSELIEYDDTECDGNCLMDDIKELLEDEELK